MKKFVKNMARKLSSGSSSRSSTSRSDNDIMSLDSGRPSSFMRSQHEGGQSSHAPAEGEGQVSMVEGIQLRTTRERERFNILRGKEFSHTRVYDEYLLSATGMDKELATAFRAVGWSKLYTTYHLGSRILTLEFLSTFSFENETVSFRLFGKEFECSLKHLSDLMDFSPSCKVDPRALRNFNINEFDFEIAGKDTRLRFSEIHNPTLRFLHRWLVFSFFPRADMRSVKIPEKKCLFALVRKIKFSPVVDIVDYFKSICSVSGPIECTSMVTRIAHNLGCPEVEHLEFIHGDIPVLGLAHFAHAHILQEECGGSIVMLYPGYHESIPLPSAAHFLYSGNPLTMQLTEVEAARHSYAGGPVTRAQSHRRRSPQQEQAVPQATFQPPQWDTGYGGGQSGYFEGGTSYHPQGPADFSYGAGRSASARYPDWHASLERDISYTADLGERALEGIGRMENTLVEQAHLQADMRFSIDAQNQALQSLLEHFHIDPNA